MICTWIGINWSRHIRRLLDARAVGEAVLTRSQLAREAICAGVSSLYTGTPFTRARPITPTARHLQRKILSNHDDFRNEKTILERFLIDRGHKVIMIPKFHCELNPIERVWGQAKRYSRAYTNFTLPG